ncbi:MAG TPA: DMT family transporter [Casimicrobiaceae bacterium]
MPRVRPHLHIPVTAVLLIVGAVFCFSLLDTCVKFLAQRYPVPLLVWARYGLQAVATVVWLAPTMRMNLVRTPQLGLQLVRGSVLVFSSLCFFSALKFLPLADATAINYLTPVVVILLSVAVLKERMTRSRWAFVGVGFFGMLLIVRPGASILHGAALLGLGAASFYATYQLLTRKLSAEDPRVTLFYPALVGTVLMTIVLPFIDRGAAMPWTHMALVALTGALGTLGHFLFILAFQRAPASALTPFTYMQIVWATLLGWLFFGNFPDGFTLTGIAIIAGSGLMLAWHERRKALAAIPEEPMAVD